MSKRKSIGQSNTLFKYFQKTPPPASKNSNGNASTDADSEAHFSKDIPKNKKRGRKHSSEANSHANSHNDDSILLPSKRFRLTADYFQSENKADNQLQSSDDDKVQRLSSFKFQENSQIDIKPQKPTEKNFPPTPKIDAIPKEKELGSTTEEDWVHCKLPWLQPAKIMDAKKRKPNHPDYNLSTLYVPPDFMKEQTPAHRQWWEMKSQHYDCVLFFKVGKFYELYHMDAIVGVNELGFSYMKGDFAHSGFPESAYARMASTLVSKGYKVARVEQTETPELMQERCKQTGKNSKYDKVVRREICQVTLRGTQVCSLQDPGPAEADATYMIAIAEEEHQGCSTYGVCFVDTSIGLFHLGMFKDDKHSSRLLTTLAHYPPALIIYDRTATSPRTVKLVSTHCPSARREPLALCPPDKTLKTLAEKYFKTSEDSDWPESIKPFLYHGDPLGLTAAMDSYLAIKALGGCVSFLTVCLLDLQILGMAQFTSYAPPDVLNKTQDDNAHVLNMTQEDNAQLGIWKGGCTMVLDAITLRNLRIVQDEGCLYEKLNFCSTAMGKRLLYQWVCAPSCNLTVIKERQEAVRSLFDNQELCQDAKNLLATMPDLERLLAKVHSLGNYLRSKHHPDSRAIFYEEKIYSKRKVLDFIAVLEGLAAALKLVDIFHDSDAALLKRIMHCAPQGKFPDYRNTLKFFEDSFDQAEAVKEGRILPAEGVDEDYDTALATIDIINEELQTYLKEQERHFKCKLAYVGTDKKRYQLEVPVSATDKADSTYLIVGTRKGFKRFSTPQTKSFLEEMTEAEVTKNNIIKDLSRRMFEKFSSHYKQWETAVQCVATLDILLALAEFARQQTSEVCLPNISYDANKKPFINIVEGRHPCIAITNDFIPNDIRLGESSSLLLLTGPNMGGKSTLMRQVGLLTVLAHLGSYVPAVECSMSLVDRVFTRLGASDDILHGQSTFLVEMNETSSIVRHATTNSLVLLDELGRGTSTYDGTAIASAVCVNLASMQCRCVFSTHYHTLVSQLQNHPSVQLGHMACMVETDESTSANSDEIPEETITFLYKLLPGACPKSYGFNAARLAGIPREITSRAQQISKKLERDAICVRTFRAIMKLENGTNEQRAKQIRTMLEALNV